MTIQAEGLTIRRFRPGDLDPVYALVCETIDTSYAAVYPPRVIEFFHEYHGREIVVSDAACGHTLVVHSGGVLVATGTRVETNVRRVFVRADRQRRGIGKKVMAELEAEALAAGIARLDLSASLPALEFYLRLGYGITSEEDYEVAPGQHLEYYEMAKQLAASG
ncbi:MAG: GNAT family N-acetyltransferase [Gaiellaceae bacterium]